MELRKMLTAHVTVVLFAATLFVTSCSSTNPPNEPTVSSGLNLTASTSTAGGNYSPRNILAVWIENSSGQFVKSLAVYGAQRRADLTRWQSASKGNTTDATTGATRSGYSSISVKWDGTDTSGNVVADGTYKVCLELTDKSSSGNFCSFSFTKGTTEETLTPENAPSFSNITIKWMPL